MSELLITPHYLLELEKAIEVGKSILVEARLSHWRLTHVLQKLEDEEGEVYGIDSRVIGSLVDANYNLPIGKRRDIPWCVPDLRTYAPSFQHPSNPMEEWLWRRGELKFFKDRGAVVLERFHGMVYWKNERFDGDSITQVLEMAFGKCIDCKEFVYPREPGLEVDCQ